MAEREERLGNARVAVQWARRATWLAPEDESGIRRFIGLLDRAGERASALQVYDEFAHRIDEEFGLSPSPETRALVDGVRARRDSLRGMVVSEGDAPETQPNLIAVLPFSVRGSAELSYLREGMVDLLSAKLDGAGELRTVDPHALLRCVQSLAPGEIDPQQGRVVAERFGAGVFVLGSLVAAGGRLHARATLYETGRPSEVLADAHTEHEADIFAIVDELVRHLLARRTTSVGGHLGRLAAMTTASLPALKAYLTGERAFRRGHYSDALEAYERAVAEDPTFALAHYRLSATRTACGMVDEAREASASAGKLRGRLAQHTRLLLAAQASWLRGDVDRAESLYLQVLKGRPEDVEAWYHLGHLRFEFNLYRGQSAVEALRPLQRALAHDPKHVGALTQLIRIAALERRLDDVDALVSRFLELSPSADLALVMRGVRAFALGDNTAQQEVLGAMAAAHPTVLAATLSDVAVYSDDLAGAERVARRIAELTPASALGATPQIITAHLAVARGDRDDATHSLTGLEKTDRPSALEHRALMLTLPFLEVTATDLMALQRSLLDWQPPPALPEARASTSEAVHEGMHAHLRLYLLGLVTARRGDLDAALAFADECERMPAPDFAAGMPSSLALGVRARVAMLRDDPGTTLTLLGRLQLGGWITMAVASPFYALATERFLRVEALIATGRREDAKGWSEGFGQRSPYELVFRDPVRQLLARS